MISKHKMKLRYHEICATALEDFCKSVTTANCGWNAKQKEVNLLRVFITGKAFEHRDKMLAAIAAKNAKITEEADDDTNQDVLAPGVPNNTQK